MNMAHDYPWASIGEEEEVLLDENPSVWILAPDIAAATVFTLIAFAFGILEPIPLSEFALAGIPGNILVPIVALVLSIGLVGIKQLDRQTTVYIITSKQVYLKEGIYQRANVDPIDVKDIVNQKWDQNVIQRVVGKGDVTIKTAASGNEDMLLYFRSVPDPKGVVEKLKRAKTLRQRHAKEQDMQFERELSEEYEDQQRTQRSSDQEEASSARDGPTDSLF
jgi:uncharacterized membrane protein YdbT with pleckstrin-like domain